MTPGIAQQSPPSAELSGEIGTGLEAAGAIAVWALLGAGMWAGVLQLIAWL